MASYIQGCARQRVPSDKLKYHVENLGVRLRWCECTANSLLPIFNKLLKNSKIRRAVWKAWYSIASESKLGKSALEDYMLEDLPLSCHRLEPPDFGFQRPAHFTDVYYGNLTVDECTSVGLIYPVTVPLNRTSEQEIRRGRRRKYTTPLDLPAEDKECIRNFCIGTAEVVRDVRSFMDNEIEQRRPRVIKRMDYVDYVIRLLLTSLT